MFASCYSRLLRQEFLVLIHICTGALSPNAYVKDTSCMYICIDVLLFTRGFAYGGIFSLACSNNGFGSSLRFFVCLIRIAIVREQRIGVPMKGNPFKILLCEAARKHEYGAVACRHSCSRRQTILRLQSNSVMRCSSLIPAYRLDSHLAA